MGVEVTQLHGVGAQLAKKLARLGIYTVKDLLFHFPFRYQDRTRVYAIDQLPIGRDALIEARIERTQVIYRRRRVLLVRVCDRSGCLDLRFYHFSMAQQATLKPGRLLRCFGEARRTQGGLEMVHPEYHFVSTAKAAIETSYMPVYATTEGVSQYSWRQFTTSALQWLQRDDTDFEELLPRATLLQFATQISLKNAIQYIHRPPADADIKLLQNGEHPTQKRLAFEEILAHTLGLRRRRNNVENQSAVTLTVPLESFVRLKRSLPFQLTGAQCRVIDEIFSDLAHPRPMARLLQGDVGSGKTLVAAAAMLSAVANGLQAALMAPTEVLAEQHYHNLKQWFDGLGFRTCLLTGRQKAVAARMVRRQLRNGEANVIVGTHALFQNRIEFAALALLVVDEQHRFGVHQRLAFKQKGENGAMHPHQLIMTATPIPRSLAMAMYADLDYSVIDELPPGRCAVKTAAIAQTRRHELIARVRSACMQGERAYWVCSLIEESEKIECQTAAQTVQLLQREMPEIRVGMMHGRMKHEERDAVMTAFRQREISLLVATTVVEVGVDVPDVSLMIIENAERFGLAQLHQLRGRVGRGHQQGSCVLMYSPPLSVAAQQRLDVMKSTADGFEVARHDMRIRGPGEMLGTRQTGAVSFRIADMVRDAAQLDEVRLLADQLVQTQPQITDRLIGRWLGTATRYAEV